MSRSRETAERSVAQADSGGHSLEAIKQAVTKITDMNTQIATAAEEQSAVAEEINRNITNIVAIAQQTAEQAQYSTSRGEQLAHMATQLECLLHQAKL